jgi:hypothetical protein
MTLLGLMPNGKDVERAALLTLGEEAIGATAIDSVQIHNILHCQY